MGIGTVQLCYNIPHYNTDFEKHHHVVAPKNFYYEMVILL